MSLKWDSSLESGVGVIDDQHKELFDAVNRLLAAMADSRGNAEVVRTVAFLKSYVVKHFGMERQLMKERGYPGAAQHNAEHDAFVKDFLALEKELAVRGASSSLVIQVNRRVCTWLREHITRTDRALGTYLSAPAAPLRAARR